MPFLTKSRFCGKIYTVLTLGGGTSKRTFVRRAVVSMKKAIIAGVLLLVMGFILWQMVAAEFFKPVEKVAAKVDKENFAWFSCPSCDRLFMAELTTRKGYCPYCGFQLMLISEDKRILGTSVNEEEFIWFFSPRCGKLFFAFETGHSGTCPYCGEKVELTAPLVADLEEPSSRPMLFMKQHWETLATGSLVLFFASVACIYLLLQRQVVLSLRPVETMLDEGLKIDLSRRHTKRKRLTLGESEDNDIVLKNPSLKDVQCIISFVKVGGKTHAYLRNRSNDPVCVNDKLTYNPQLKDSDKVRLGEIVFEVHTRGER
ncbi:MAG: hypothetical protein Kow0099_24730 [Candidatus Abyssubacteria bacterium]